MWVGSSRFHMGFRGVQNPVASSLFLPATTTIRSHPNSFAGGTATSGRTKPHQDRLDTVEPFLSVPGTWAFGRRRMTDTAPTVILAEVVPADAVNVFAAQARIHD